MLIKRDEGGKIVGLYMTANASKDQVTVPPGWEWADETPQDVIEFARTLAETHSGLQQSDFEFIRVLEDLIELLVQRAVIRFTDMPIAAQEKLLSRKDARAALNFPVLLSNDSESQF